MLKWLYFFILITLTPLLSQEIILNQNFDGSISTQNLFISNNPQSSGSIINDNYVFENKSNKNPIFSTEKLDIIDLETGNYIIEIKLKYQSGKDKSEFGIVLNQDEEKSDYYLFSIRNDGFYKVQSYYDDAHHDQMEWKKSIALKANDWNILRIEKNNFISRYYINGKNVYNDDYFVPNGDNIGVYLSEPGQKIEVDYIKFWQNKSGIDLIENPLTNVKKEIIEILNSESDELSPRLASDGKTIYFTRDGYKKFVGKKKNQDIWYSEMKYGKWTLPQMMPSPINNDGANSMITITPDNNTIYVSNLYNSKGEQSGMGMSVSKRTNDGWTLPKKIEIENFYNNSPYVSYYMSQDQKVLFSSMQRDDTRGGMDIYISLQKEDGSYGSPMNLGDSINTFTDDFNPYLAADNKTLYYITAGLPGYGKEDVWVSKRLDDTWLNWSKPKNLGSGINTEYGEFAFSLTAKGDEAYMVSYERLDGYKGGGDIVKVQLSKSAQPDPVVLVYGKVLNKKTNQPIEANIEYFGLSDDKNYGSATSDSKTGEYKIVLPRGVYYGFKSSSPGYISISENLDVVQLENYTEIERNLYLAPVEVGQSFRLNNVFFDSGKDILRDESENELENLKKLLQDNQYMVIEIEGHTDNVGDDNMNLDLSSRRANSVVQWLIKYGIEANRLTSKGYGKTKPIGSNSTDEGRQLNRRVEFTIIR